MKKKLFPLLLALVLVASTCAYAQDDWNDNSPAVTSTSNDDWNDNAPAAASSNDDWNDNAPATASSNDDWNDNAPAAASSNDDWNDNDNSYSSTDSKGVSRASSGKNSGGSGIGGWLLMIGIAVAGWWFFKKRKNKKAAEPAPDEPEHEQENDEDDEDDSSQASTQLADDVNGISDNPQNGNKEMLDKILNNDALKGVMGAFGLNQQSGNKSVNNNKQYYVQVKGQQHGPYTLQQMLGYVQQGRMNTNTLVRTSDSNQWLAASSFAELGLGASASTFTGGASEDQFMVSVKGQQHGPYTLQQMQGFIQQGRMNRNTQVMICGRTGWKNAGDDPRLLQMLQRAGY